MKQIGDSLIFVAAIDLVAGLTGNAELTAQASHLLTIKQPGDKSETFFHDITLLPRHVTLSRKKEKVLPLCQEGHKGVEHSQPLFILNLGNG